MLLTCPRCTGAFRPTSADQNNRRSWSGGLWCGGCDWIQDQIDAGIKPKVEVDP